MRTSLAFLSLSGLGLCAWSATAAPQARSAAPGGSPLGGTHQALCADGVEDQASGACLTASSIPTLGSLYPLGPELNVDPAGNVGIGTTTPGNRLDVIGGAAFQGGHVFLRNTGAPLGTETWGLVVDTAGRLLVGQTTDVPPATGTLTTTPLVIEPGAPGNSLFVNADGEVGIGTPFPDTTLDVGGDVSQPRSARGLVKATAAVDCGLPPSVTRQFNLLPGGGTITVSRLGQGAWEVDFGVDVSDRFYQAAPGNPNATTPIDGFVSVAPRSGNANAVFVTTRDTAGTASDFVDFFLTVF